jgi:hypothetical protein
MESLERLTLTVFGGIFLALGLTGGVLSYRTGAAAAETRYWEPVDCFMIDSTVLPGSGSGRYQRAATLALRYRYIYRGVEHESTSYSAGIRISGSTTEMRLRQLELLPGKRVIGYVNPDAPDKAVLSRGNAGNGLLIFASLCFSLIGAAILFFTWRRENTPEVLFQKS